MATSRRTPTAVFRKQLFKPHGQMDFRKSGQLNVLVATGPFNLELVIAADTAQDPQYEALAEKGRWGTVLVFRESAMAPLDAIAEITRILCRRREQGYVPVAVALVFGPGVEGANLMKMHYLNAYKNAGIEGRIFERQDLAEQWLSSILSA